MSLRLGDYVFDRATRQLTCGGRAVPLTPKAFALIEALVDAAPAALSKEALYDTLWPGVFVEMGNLYTIVAEVRGATGAAFIRTVHRFGYALGTDVFSAAEPAAFLLVASRSIALQRGENVITRDLLLAPDVSRRHARIVIDGEKATVEDFGSKNGTWIDGRRISSPTAVSNGDAITFGLTRAMLAFAAVSETVTAERAS